MCQMFSTDSLSSLPPLGGRGWLCCHMQQLHVTSPCLKLRQKRFQLELICKPELQILEYKVIMVNYQSSINPVVILINCILSRGFLQCDSHKAC